MTPRGTRACIYRICLGRIAILTCPISGNALKRSQLLLNLLTPSYTDLHAFGPLTAKMTSRVIITPLVICSVSPSAEYLFFNVRGYKVVFACDHCSPLAPYSFTRLDSS